MNPIQRALTLLMAREQITAAELATKAKVSQETVDSLLAGGTTNPAIHTLICLAEALHVTVNTLIYPACIEVRVISHEVSS